MEDKLTWVSLSYTLPITPSGNRVYIWRKLRELGAGALRQGAAVLPDSKQHVQHMLALAGKIRQMGGDASVIQLRFVEEADCLRMVESFRRQSAREYRELLLETAKLYEQNLQTPDRARRSAIQKKYQRARSRDFFGAQEALGGNEQVGNLLQDLELDLDGGWGLLMDELRLGLAQLGRVVTGRSESAEIAPNEDSSKEE